MGLIEVADIETATGTPVEFEDEPRVQWYINLVSEFIEQYTGRAFSVQEDAEFTTRASSWGVIEFPELTSVSNVTLIDGYSGSYDVGGYYFDGLNSIYNLEPYGVYRVTVTFGSDEVPLDIQGIVTLLVTAGAGFDSGAVGGLIETRVGNVVDKYGVTEEGVVTISELMQATLDDYNAGTARP